MFRLGYRLPGVYVIDPSGSRNVSKSVEVYCQDGWTYLLRRGLEINVRVLLDQGTVLNGPQLGLVH